MTPSDLVTPAMVEAASAAYCEALWHGPNVAYTMRAAITAALEASALPRAVAYLQTLSIIPDSEAAQSLCNAVLADLKAGNP